jgi:hypothetical protein
MKQNMTPEEDFFACIDGLMSIGAQYANDGKINKAKEVLDNVQKYFDEAYDKLFGNKNQEC